MKTTLLRSILSALVIAGSALTASAQTAPVPAKPTVDISKLGPAIQAIVAAHRDTTKSFLEARKATLALLKNASPKDIEAMKATLHDIMVAHQKDQRELAKAIRDAIKARRDQQHSKPSGG